MNYFDHSATTPINNEVLSLMQVMQTENYGNPSSIHLLGQKSRSIIENARTQIAKAINADQEQVIFTSGGTESNNQVLWSMLHNNKKHIVSSKIEHPAVIKVIEFLRCLGLEYSLIGVDSKGIISIKDLENATSNNTGLISIMLANNEVGTIQPIKEIVQIANEKNILVHSDAVQCLGKMTLDVKDLGLDFLSLSAHKFYGPKGAGILYVKNPTRFLSPLIIGGNQEGGLRGGTENLVSIAGMGLAAELATTSINDHIEHLNTIEEQFKIGITNISQNIIFNGHQDYKLPGLVSVSFPGLKSNTLLTKLDRKNIYVSNGSACGSGDITPSPILSAMGYDNSINLSTLRFSFGITNTSEEIAFLISELDKIL